ncbi:MAG: DinB family protein [Saprospiraceae bacterium]|nr:DinB family protein [Saprospiraceae bacterium]MCB9325719.1 DinB family protein [Lewinellaceae bacterium]
MKNSRPASGDYAAFYEPYVSKITSNDIVSTLEQSLPLNLGFLKSIPREKWDYKYAEDKWNIKEILIHIIDGERIFSNRALRIARHDRTPLPGFDQNAYAPYMNAADRTIESIIEEYEAVRRSTICLFRNFSEKMWLRHGLASGTSVTSLAMAYIIAGHEIHHFKIINERYL